MVLSAILIEETAALTLRASNAALTATKTANVSVFIFSEPAASFAIYPAVARSRRRMNRFGITTAAKVTLYFGHVSH